MSETLGHGAALAALTVVVIELAARLPMLAAMTRILSPTMRAAAVLRAPGISDHWKERAVLSYARRTISGVGAFLICLAILVTAAAALGGAADFLLPGFAAFALGPIGIVIASLFALGYLPLRRGWADVRL